MTEYAHGFAGTIIKAYDDWVFFRQQYKAPLKKVRAPGDDFYFGACKALDNIIHHATGRRADQWTRKELEALMIELGRAGS